ncbi:hypothetical protein BO82DRAFT_432712 [Aspergillus uvarum CBS 121591]|uniref:NAD(P)-binding protein n=1 Tax=Aspergillus uvarum CBS 121591 TaxID=1448315 RepID=A0A319C5E0_9EURO|nr:hypothetical protein BO82DRAFT_432712 [Aspergillus uvarum CBS 121591]PYH81066.1 hypothetical protein BO82DRAFT_432712 [Aspergillus uvarum CBS 121591]
MTRCVACAKRSRPGSDDRLDILVNNAGICYTMTAIDTDVSQVQQMFDVNVFGPNRMVHTFHSWLIRAKGCVVNIGSVGGTPASSSIESFHTPLQKEFRAHVQRVPNTTDRVVYSQSVLQQSLRKCPPAWYWVGNTSTFVDCFAFRTVWDLIAWPVFRLGKLKSKTMTNESLK